MLSKWSRLRPNSQTKRVSLVFAILNLETVDYRDTSAKGTRLFEAQGRKNQNISKVGLLMLVNIHEIKVNDRIRKDFGNIEELAKDIKENGLINPPTVTPELELIAGERRLRACKYLNYEQIEVRVVTVRDEEHQLNLEISENENRKEFTYSERMDWAKRLERIESIKAKERMSDGGKGRQNSDNLRSDDLVANKSGFGSRDTYRKAKFIDEHADEETIEKLDKEEISIHKAWQETREKLKLAEERASHAEQQAKQARESEQIALSKIEELEKREPKKEIIYKIDQERLDELNAKIENMSGQVENARVEKQELKNKLKLQQERTKEYNQLKKEIVEKDEELASLSREQTRMKNRRTILDQASYMSRDLGGWVRKIKHYIYERDGGLQGDADVNRAIDSMIKNLEETLEEIRNWGKVKETTGMNQEDKEIVDVEFIEI